MIDPQTVQQIRRAPVVERLQLIELILQSLKEEMLREATARQAQTRTFMLRKHNLGVDVHPDRDELYAERAS